MSEYALSDGYDLLRQPDFDAEKYDSQMTLGKSTNLLRHFPWLYSIIEATPFWLTKVTSPIIDATLREREHILDHAIAMRANSGTVSKKGISSRPSLLEGLTVTTLLPKAEKSADRLISEAVLAMSAGTLTTSHCLKTATYHILANTKINKELMRQLMDGFPDPGTSYGFFPVAYVMSERVRPKYIFGTYIFNAYLKLELPTSNTPIETPPTLNQLEKIPYLMANM